MTRCASVPAFLFIAGIFSASIAVAQPAPESVYAPPALPSETEGINEGGVHFELGVSYFTDYVYRGVEIFEVPSHEDSLNLQIDSKLSFDLGKLPHPFVSVFTNVADNDPLSNFQEIRPSVGFDWTIKPIIISAGYTTYLYPERTERQTSEVFFELTLDDKALFASQTVPVPYVLAVYDFDKYDGVYLEAGLKYRLAFDEIGVSFTAVADVGYVNHYAAQLKNGAGTEPGFFTDAQTTGGNVYGFQHYDLGLIGTYSLNKLFNVSTRYGEWSIRGSVYYTNGIDDNIEATSQIWGGAGIVFQY